MLTIHHSGSVTDRRELSGLRHPPGPVHPVRRCTPAGCGADEGTPTRRWGTSRQEGSSRSPPVVSDVLTILYASHVHSKECRTTDLELRYRWGWTFPLTLWIRDRVTGTRVDCDLHIQDKHFSFFPIHLWYLFIHRDGVTGWGSKKSQMSTPFTPDIFPSLKRVTCTTPSPSS